MPKSLSLFAPSLLAVALSIAMSAAFAQTNPDADTTIRLGQVPWEEVFVKNEVLAQVLTPLGYTIERLDASLPIVLRGMAQGDIDIFVENWLPSSASMLQPYFDAGSLTTVASNLDEGVVYMSAVPAFVYEAGVRSMEDLQAHRERFRGRYYGIEPGNDGNEIILEAIANNTYGLGDWQIIESSTEGMLAEVARAVRNENWIVFSGWQPHWMNITFDMRYLADPEGIWGEESSVDTVMNSEFMERNPNISRFFEQFRLRTEDQSQWVHGYGYEGREASDVAEEWILANTDTVLMWLEGIVSVDGEDAAEVFLASLQ